MTDPNEEPHEEEEAEEETPSPLYPDSGPKREEMMNEFLPEQGEWSAKTILDLSDPAAVAALKQFEQMYPEVEDLQPLIDAFLHEFFKSRTSVKGKSREEIVGVLKAAFGQSSDGEGGSKLELVAPEDD